jgi:hypothetical protein
MNRPNSGIYSFLISVLLVLSLDHQLCAQTTVASADSSGLFMGGRLVKDGTGLTLDYSDPVNSKYYKPSFRLVTFEGQYAWLTYVKNVWIGPSPKQRDSADGNLLFTQKGIIFNPVSGMEWRYDQKFAMPEKMNLTPKLATTLYPAGQLTFARAQTESLGPLQLSAPGLPTLTVPLNAKNEMTSFLVGLNTNFKETTDSFIAFAQIHDPASELGANATFALVTPEESKAHNQAAKQELKAADRAYDKEHGTSTLSMVGSILSATAQAAPQAIAAGQAQGRGDTATATREQVAARTTFDNSLSNPAAGVAPVNESPVSAASTNAGSGGGAAVRYSGPQSQWVSKLLNSAGAYSCTPERPPARAATFTCQRDAEIAKARATAWAIECSFEQKIQANIDQFVPLMMTNLKTAGQLCQAGNHPVCDSDRVITCSELPR